MGVRGLQSFLKKNRPQLSITCLLNNMYLVIDGMNLAWYLFSQLFTDPNSPHHKSYKYGSNYVAYAALVREFFEALAKCSIKPIILFDGSTMGDDDDKASKEETIYERALEKFNYAFRLNEFDDRYDRSMLMCRNVMITFKCVCRDLNLDCDVTPFEADPHIARIANERDCPVLTNDSDFIIYELKRGFILLDDLDFRNIRRDNNGCESIICNTFSQRNICRFMGGLVPDNLALMSVLLGNDYVNTKEFSHVTYDICDRAYYGRLTAETNAHRRIANMLEWLRNKTLEQALSEITSRVLETHQLRLRRKLKKLLRSYRIEEEVNFLERLKAIYPDERAIDQNPDHLPRNYLFDLLRKDQLSTLCLDIIFHNTHYIYLEVEDIRLASVNSLIYRIYALYVTILRPRSYTSLTSYQKRLAREEDAFIICDRVEQEYRKVKLYPLEKLAIFGSLENLNLYTFIALEPPMKKSLLMCAFRFNTEEYNLLRDTFSNILMDDYLDQATLCLILVKFIGLETHLPPKPQFVEALVLTLFYYAYLRQKVVAAVKDNENYGKLWIKLKRHELTVNGETYDDIPSVFRRVVHFINQLQVAITCFIRLNFMTGSPFHMIRLDSYFNSTLIYRITKGLRFRKFVMSQLCESCDCLLDVCESVKVQVHADE